MLNGIKANGGFWIGKYETGYLDTPTSSNYNSTSRTAVVRKDAYPYNYIDCIDSALKTEQLAMQAGADGSLLFGTQWDLTIGYLVNRGGVSKSSATYDSTNWGNYDNKELTVTASTINSGWPKGYASTYNWATYTGNKPSGTSKLLSTGAVEDVTNKLNIVDLAGNCREWTMEAHDSAVYRAFRGGNSGSTGSNIPASRRLGNLPQNSYDYVSSRPSLYGGLNSAYAVDGVEYYILKDAIEQADDGDTIAVLRDVKDTSTAVINKNITINLQGYAINRKSESITIDSGCTVNIQGTGKITSTVTTLTNNGTLNITNSIITSTGLNTSAHRGITNNGTLVINDGTVKGVYYGINNSDSTSVTSSITMNGGTVETTATSATSGTTYGIYNDGTSSSNPKTVTINSGTVKGGTYGIYNYGNYAITNIGNETDTLSTTSPVVSGGTYGVYRYSGTVNFYNGILKGTTAGYGGTIANTRTGCAIVTDTEDIDGTTYQTAYLEKLLPNYMVDNTIETQTLAEAIEEASDGSTIRLQRDYTDTSSGTISKNVTLDLQTYTLTRSATVTVNSGVTTTITGSTGGKLTTGTTNLNTITNAGTLTIDGSATIEHNGTSISYYAINNSTAGAILNVKSGTITSATYGIYNNNSTVTTNIGDGTVTLSTTNPTISGGTYGVYNNSGKWTYNNGTIQGTTSSFYDGDVETNGGLEGGVRTDYIIVTGESGSYKTAHLEKMTDVTTPWLPAGASYTNTDLNTGVTMKDSHDNEWTWVVVPKTITASASTIGANDDPIGSSLETALINYAAKVVTNRGSYSDTWVSEAQSGFTSDEYITKKRNMLNGIKANGGFWIGKYETGYLDTPTSSNYQSTSRTAVVQKDAYPYNYINLPNSALKTEQLAMQAGGDGSLLFGTQWDLTLGYLVNRGGVSKYSVTDNSTNWGNYQNKELTVTASITKTGWPKGWTSTYNWATYTGNKSSGTSKLLSTGAVEDVTNKLNIVDLAGNCWEWTMEAYYTSRADRGGSYDDNGSGYPASYRGYGSPSYSYDNYSSRPSLYVELNSAYAIDGAEYYTLKDAVEHASNGDTITVLRDVTDSLAVEIDKNITINLQGYTINRKSESITIDSGCTVNIQGTGEITSKVTTLINNGTLNITNSTITSTGSNTYRGIANSGTLAINNGTVRGGYYGIHNSESTSIASSITMNGGIIETTATSGTRYGIYNTSGTNSSYTKTVTINSGTVKGGTYGIVNTGAYATTNIGDSNDVLSITTPAIVGGTYGMSKNSGTMNFYNGILKGTTAGYSANTANTRTGYAIATDTEDIDGTTYQTAFLSDSIYSITDGGTTNYYLTLADAVTNATGEQTIKLLHNAPDTVAVTIGKNITLDLQSYTITKTGTITVSNNYTTNIIGTGCITSGNNPTISNSGTLNVTDATIICTNTSTTASAIANNGTLTINNATIKGYNYAINNSTSTSKATSITINGGTIETTSTSGTRYGINNTSGTNSSCTKTVTINDGTVIGGTYGIYNSGTYATTNIGDSNDTLSITSPVVSGGTVGIYNSNGAWNFYNGIIRGTTTAYNTAPADTRSGYGIASTTETIDEVTYRAAYLSDSSLIVTPINDTVVKYNSTTAEISGNIEGTLSATSSDNNIATASINGTTLTVTGTGVGESTITVTDSANSKTALYVIEVLEPNYSITDNGTTIYYNTIESAINTATAGQTIKVEQNVTDGTTATVNKNLSLDLQTYTLTRTAVITVNANCTLDILGTGKITNATTNTIENSGTLNITTNATIENTNGSYYAINNSGTSTVNISNGTVQAVNQTIRNRNCTGTVNITGGTIQTTATTGTRYAIYNYSTNTSYRPKVNITGGIIQNTVGTAGTGYGVYNSGTYATTYIGSQSDTLSTTTPMILGRTNGMYNSSGKWYFYNGVIGSTGTAYNGAPTIVREQCAIATGTKAVDDTTYNTAYLEPTSFYVTPRYKGVGIGKTETITVGGTGYGNITAVSSSTSIATVSVSGDTITITGVAEGTCTITVTEGTNNKTDTCIVQVATPNYSITNGGYATYYSTLALAIAGGSNGDTIKVEQDVTDTSTATFNKNLTLDLQTYTITRSATVTISSTKDVTITGSTGGKLTSGTANVNTITNSGGTLTIDGEATIEHNGTSTSYYAIYNNSAGSILNVKSGTITSVTRGIYNNNASATTNIGDATQTMNTINPVIIGGTYGVYRNNGTVNFYSGILKGKTAGYSGTITPREDYKITTGTEEIDGVTYNTAYLKLNVLKMLQVGDTVTYAPTGNTYNWQAKYATSNLATDGTADVNLYSTETGTGTNMRITNWNVFKIDEDKEEIQLVPSTTAGVVRLQGAQGYNNAVQLLDAACSKLYSDSSKGITARSIDMDDLEPLLDSSKLQAAKDQYTHNNTTSYSHLNANDQVKTAYSKSYSCFPRIYEEEKNRVINGNKKTSGLGLSSPGSKLYARNESTSLTGQTTTTSATTGYFQANTSIQPYQTYYGWTNAFHLKGNCADINTASAYSKMLTQIFWIASRVVTTYETWCAFEVRAMGSGGSLANSAGFDSRGGTSGNSHALFPVVTLSSDLIELDGSNYKVE